MVDTPRWTAGKAARSRSESSGVTGEPPSEIDRTADRSRPGSVGSVSTRIAIVGTAPQTLTRSRSMRSSTWPELKRPSRNTIVLPPSMASSSDWMPPMWNSGPLCRMTSGGRSPRSWCGSRFDTTIRFCRLAMTERCASTAALARPVVPAVKMMSAGSSSPPGGRSGMGSGGAFSAARMSATDTTAGPAADMGLEPVGDLGHVAAFVAGPRVAQQRRLLHFKHLAVHDAVPAELRPRDQAELGAYDGGEPFRPTASAGRGPPRDELRVGHGPPDLHNGMGVVTHDVDGTHGELLELGWTTGIFL